MRGYATHLAVALTLAAAIKVCVVIHVHASQQAGGSNSAGEGVPGDSSSCFGSAPCPFVIN